MSTNEPLNETEQAQLIQIMQLFMQLPERDTLSLHFYADASGSVFEGDSLVAHFHDLEEGVNILQHWHEEEE